MPARLTVLTAFKTEGADQASKEARKLARDYKFLSGELDPAVKGQQRFERAQRILSAQLERGRITQGQYNEQLRLARDRFLGATQGAQVYGDRLQQIGTRLSSAGARLTVGLTLPIVAAGAASLKAAVDAEEAENLFEVSFGGMASAARAWSEELGQRLGLNRVELRRTSATIFKMVEAMGFAQDAAFDMATGVTQLALDMSSIENIPIEDAFRRLRSGLTGEQEPLRQFGILIDAATVKATAYRVGIAEVGSELTQQQKVMARWIAIQEQTVKTQGDLARTIESPANQLRVLRNQVEEAAIAFGQSLIPLLQEVLPILKEMVDRFNEMSPETRELVIRIGLLAAALGPVLGLVGKLTSGVGSFIKLSGDIIAGEGRLAAALKNPWVIGLAAATTFFLVLKQRIDQFAAEMDRERERIVTDLRSFQALVADLRQAQATGELPMQVRIEATKRLAQIRADIVKNEKELADAQKQYLHYTAMGEAVAGAAADKRAETLREELETLKNEENTLGALVYQTSTLLDLSEQVPPPFGGADELRRTKEELTEILESVKSQREVLAGVVHKNEELLTLITATREQYELYQFALSQGIDIVGGIEPGLAAALRQQMRLTEEAKKTAAAWQALVDLEAQMFAPEPVGDRFQTAAEPGESILPASMLRTIAVILDPGFLADLFADEIDQMGQDLAEFKRQQWEKRWREMGQFAVDELAGAMYQIVDAIRSGTDDIQDVFEDTFRQLGGQLGSAAVEAAGGGIFAQLGGQIGGELLGAEIGKLLGGLFGSAEPHAIAEVILHDGRVTSFFTRYASELTAAMNEATSRIAEGIAAIFDDLGGELVGLEQIRIEMQGERITAWVAGIRKTFESVEDAVEWAIVEAVKSAEAIGLAPQIVETLRNSTAHSLDQLQRELANAVAVRDINLSPLEAELRTFVDERLKLFDDAWAQGISTAGDVVLRTVEDFNSRVRAFRGFKADPAEEIREQGRAIQQQQRLLRAELLARQASIQAMIAEAQARVAVTMISIDGTRTLLTAGMKVGEAFGRLGGSMGAVATAMGVSTEALELALVALGEAIASIDELTDRDIGDAVRRQRRDEQQRRAEGRQSIREEVGAFGLGPFGLKLREIMSIVPDLTDRMEGLGFSAEEAAHLLALATEEEQRRLTALRDQLGTEAGSVLARAYEFLGRGAEAERLRFEMQKAMLLIDIARLQIAEQELGLNLPIIRELEGLVPMINDMTWRTWTTMQAVANAAVTVARRLGDATTPGPPPPVIPPIAGPPPTIPGGQSPRELALQELRRLEISALPSIVQDLIGVEEQFAHLREVLGDTERVQAAYNAVLAQTLQKYLRPIVDLQHQLTANDNLSPLKIGERMAMERARFAEIQARIAAGDLTVLEDVPGAAQDLLEVARQFFPQGSAGYQAIFDLVNQVLTNAQNLVSPTTTTTGLPGNGDINIDFSGVLDALNGGSNAQLAELQRIKNRVVDLIWYANKAHGHRLVIRQSALDIASLLGATTVLPAPANDLSFSDVVNALTSGFGIQLAELQRIKNRAVDLIWYANKAHGHRLAIRQSAQTVADALTAGITITTPPVTIDLSGLETVLAAKADRQIAELQGIHTQSVNTSWYLSKIYTELMTQRTAA